MLEARRSVRSDELNVIVTEDQKLAARLTNPARIALAQGRRVRDEDEFVGMTAE
jgi:hypothetical protein